MPIQKSPHLSILLLSFTLAACAHLKPAVDQPLVGPDGIACIGAIETPPEGLVEIDDRDLLEQSLGASDQGKLCAGQVFRAEEPVTVYRVWNQEKSYTIYGSWWSFEEPEGPKQEYRKDNGICPSWSSLDQMSSCTIKVGTRVVVGPGQSARCQNMTYAKSDVNQVYIPNNSRDNIILVENCTSGTDWP
ncbi:MAG: hypothetical protein ACR2PT_24115 [Endozoicomonas sp.]